MTVASTAMGGNTGYRGGAGWRGANRRARPGAASNQCRIGQDGSIQGGSSQEGPISGLRRVKACIIAGALASTLTTSVVAQTTGRGDSVLDRARPDYDPVGIRLGTIWVFPAHEIAMVYDDNVFAKQRSRADDVIVVQSPQVVVKSDFSRHALGFELGADLGRHVDFSAENYDDIHVATNGRLDIHRESRILASAGWDRLHADRSSPDDVAGLEPTIYRRSQGDIALQQGFNRFGLRLGGSVRQFDFDDSSAATGAINNDDRDRTQYRIESRVQYAVADAYLAFIDAGVNRADYVAVRDDNGFNRDSDGHDLFIGVAADLTGIILGEISVGRVDRKHDDARFADVSEIAFQSRLTWNVTRLTSVRGELAREVDETAVNGASATLTTSATIGIDHELLRNVILHAGAAHREQEFIGIDRTDNILAWRLGARYLVNRAMSLTLDYDGVERESTQPTAEFVRNRVMLRLRLQM